MAETDGPPEENTVEGKPVEVAQPPVESKPAEATENSAAATTTQSLTRDLYDWASRLTSEAGNGLKDYYWTPQMERVVTKLKLTKRTVVGVVGVQGAGKSAAMCAVVDRIADEEGFGYERVIAVKVAETGGLMDSFKSTFHDSYHERVDSYVKQEVENGLSFDRAFLHKAQRVVNRDGDQDAQEQFWTMHRGEDVKGMLSPVLRNLVPRRVVRERETEALQSLIDEQRVILIDMPDYPKHDRRLIARDLDDIQGLWNRLMMHPDVASDASIVVFIQKETFNHADHFLYGKMDLIDLKPLETSQLLEAYKRKWGGYEPFTQDALEYIARMSRGIFRRFKRYIGLAVETQIAERAQADISNAPIDLELVKKALTEEELMRDLEKELDAIFKNRAQKQTALRLIKLLSDEMRPISQKSAAETLELNEMAVSRVARTLQEHGYIKRTTRTRDAIVYDKKLDEHVESSYTEKLMELVSWGTDGG